MLPTHAVGIDLGTTYSCIAYLNEHGEPVTIPNRDGELSTPSIVMFDGNHVIVGTEALRNSIRSPDKVVMHAKRHMGNPQPQWTIDGRSYTAVDISTHILRQLISDAKERIGKIERAVITVPAQFSDVQRQATIEAGRRAGLKHVDIINEPVAAALCFVLGTEGIWFTELATAQNILVVDLGGGTFDLSLVKYEQNSVSVRASGGDLHLGGIDWNAALEKRVATQFKKEFGINPLEDRESRQALAIEVEQAKRSLSVRPRAALTCQHAGQRKTYQIEVEQFESLSKSLVERMQNLTVGLLKDNKLGWAHVDVVLTTGGASRMPMVREMLKRLSGRTLNSSLSPDQSIAHGATYYAGMLLTNSSFAKSILSEAAAARLQQFKQQSANARALGILVRDTVKGGRIPHYILAANTQLPAEARQTVGTVIPNQRRAHLAIVESGTAADTQFVELGHCIVEPLPADLPEGTEIEVTIRYDEQARVHVSAKVIKTGQEAHTEIVRPENLLVSAISEAVASSEDVAMKQDSRPSAKPVFSPVPMSSASQADVDFPGVAGEEPKPSPAPVRESAPRPKPQPAPAPPVSKKASSATDMDSFDLPIPLCDTCGEALDTRGRCPKCTAVLKSNATSGASRPANKPSPDKRRAERPAVKPSSGGAPAARAPQSKTRADDELLDLDADPAPPRPSRAASPAAPQAPAGQTAKPKPASDDDFLDLILDDN